MWLTDKSFLRSAWIIGHILKHSSLDVASYGWKAERNSVTASSRCVQSMLRYQSNLLKVLKTLLILPAFLTGLSEQSQVLEVELFSNYVDDPVSPASLWEWYDERVSLVSPPCSILHQSLLSLRSCPTRCRSTHLTWTFMLISLV